MYRHCSGDLDDGSREPWVHFWLPNHGDLDVDRWDPDLDPTRFSDGFGHAFLELFVRLRDRGFPTSLGPSVAPGADVVVVFSKTLDWKSALKFACQSPSQRRLIIESDWPAHRRLPAQAHLLICPLPALSDARTRMWLPLLPQRGLIPRHPSRLGRMSVIDFKGDREQLPPDVDTPAFRDAIRDLGMSWPPYGPGNRKFWHDFGSVDVAICVRDPAVDTSRKPATKLINAWAAGSVPIVGPEPSYVSLGVDGTDCLLVEDSESLLRALQRLATDRALVRTLEAGVADRMAEFSRDRVVELWSHSVRGVAFGEFGSRPFGRRSDLRQWFLAALRNAVGRSRT